MSLKFNLIIGIESHIRLNFNKKLFSYIKFSNDNINDNVSLYDLGIPGVLPILNLFLLSKIVLFGFFLKSEIYNISFFFRKSYFYPDISKNYQITQYCYSLFKNGYILIYNNYVFLPYYKTINIIQFHLEEDTSKIIYKDNFSLLDYNRSGYFLLEIVTFPCISDFYESYLYLNNLKCILNYLNISDCNMQLGKFRFDVNISLKFRKINFSDFKVEIKNLNSLNSLFNILNYEVKRLLFIYINGDFVYNHTITYDIVSKTSFFLRFKESFYDYKYFSDPDLFYLIFKNSFILKIFIKNLNLFLFYKNIFIKISKKDLFFYFIFYKKFFYLFLIFGFYYKDHLLSFKFFFNNVFLKIIYFNKNFFSLKQLFLIFNLLLFDLISFDIFKKIFFFLLKNFLFFDFYLYKIIHYNNLKNIFDKKKFDFFLINFIINNLFFIHIYIYNKKLINKFVFFFVKNFPFINYSFIIFCFKKKILIFREMDEWFKSHN